MFVLVAAIQLSSLQFARDESKQVSPQIVNSWLDAGIEYGRITTDKFGCMAFELGQAKNGVLPAFKVGGKDQKLSELPAPDAPFGLVCERMTDAGVKQLAFLKQLQILNLSGTDVTDAGLKELAALKLKRLQTLNLNETQVTDAGVKQLAGLKLKTLFLPIQAHTDLGLKNYLAAIEPPTKIDLQYWQISDAGLKELSALKQLQSLDLSFTDVTDAGLKELAAFKQLQTLNVGFTEVTDAGLKELATFKQLQTLDLKGTEVTSAGVKELQKALPKCKIISDIDQSKSK